MPSGQSSSKVKTTKPAKSSEMDEQKEDESPGAELVEKMGRLKFIEKKLEKKIPVEIPGMIPVTHAYHVTNIPVLYKLDGSLQPQPNWTELEAFTANDRTFDKGVLQDGEWVFFSTTLYRGGLPTFSVYPRQNGQEGVEYCHVQVPLARFNDCRIKLCSEVFGQRMLVMCQPGEFNDLVDVTDNPDYTYLRRDAQNNWYTNDFSNPTTEYFVNFAVKGNVELTPWDKVVHRPKNN